MGKRGTVEEWPCVRIGMLRSKKTVYTDGGRAGNPSETATRGRKWIAGVQRLIWRTGNDAKVAEACVFVVGSDSGNHPAVGVNIDGVESVARIAFTRLTWGNRPWFICPACGGRAGALFLAREGLTCRRCRGLIYASQNVRNRAFWRRLTKGETDIKALRGFIATAGRLS